MSLIKPPIYPAIHPQESTVGYIHRLRELNGYMYATWLFDSEVMLKGPLTNSIRKSALLATEWCGYEKESSSRHSEQLPSHFKLKYHRFCPECLEENGIWLDTWQVKFTIACVKHRVWLQEECCKCGERARATSAGMKECRCDSKAHQNSKAKECPELVLLLQRFMNGEDIHPYRQGLLLAEDYELTALQRFELVYGLLNMATAGKRSGKTGVDSRLSELSLNKPLYQRVASALLDGETGFSLFLQSILNQASNLHEGNFTKLPGFYQKLVSCLASSCLEGYRKVILQFINNHYSWQLNNRRSDLLKEAIESHPWMTIQKACCAFHINKSDLVRHIEAGVLKSKAVKRGDRHYKVVYAPDVKNLHRKLMDELSAAQVIRMLGITPHQFRSLQGKGIFQYELQPSEDCGRWRYSKREITRFLRRLRKHRVASSGCYISISSIMKRYGSQLEKPLVTVIKAIESGELIAHGVGENVGLRGIAIKEVEFLEWLSTAKKHACRMSVPRVAKMMKLQQEFVYQLVRSGLLHSEKDPETGLRYILSTDIQAFKSEYLLLRDLAKSEGICSRGLMKLLSKEGKHPIEEYNGVKLRQRVYRKQVLLEGDALTLVSLDFLPHFSSEG